MFVLVPSFTLLYYGPGILNPILPAPPIGPPYPIPSEKTALQTKQSGQVTPGHLAAWATDNVLVDAGVQFNNTFGKFVSTLANVNFNSANTDNPIPINLPIGYTRYRIENILLSGASGSIVTATCGVFTVINASGFAIVSGGTAVALTQIANDVGGNLQSLTVNLAALGDSVIYFRVQTPNGTAVTANVSVYYQPLP